jgi:hypothetical protein
MEIIQYNAKEMYARIATGFCERLYRLQCDGYNDKY